MAPTPCGFRRQAATFQKSPHPQAQKPELRCCEGSRLLWVLPVEATKTPPVPVKEAWHPSNDEQRDLLTCAWMDLSDEMQELKAQLGCDEAFIADMLRAMADTVEQG